jgi:hypothetical protein
MTFVLTITTLVAATSGCMLLALSQRRHWQAVTGTASQARSSVRPAGWGLIGVSLVMAVMREGTSFGALLWPMLIGGGALITVAILTLKPEMLTPLAKLFADRGGDF